MTVNYQESFISRILFKHKSSLLEKKLGDYVIAIGKTVTELFRLAFAQVGLNYENFVVIDPIVFRPTEVYILLGNPKKSLKKIRWKAKTNLENLIFMMAQTDINRVHHAPY